MYFYNVEFFTSSYFTQHFNCDGIVNSKQSWISDDSTVKIIWDTTLNAWKLSGDTLGNVQVINTNPQQPPINGNWKVLGFPYNVTANQGECVPVSALSATANVNNPTCSCDGTISITARGGVPPYQFSVNGGTTFVNTPLFTNLCGGLISWVVKDSVDTVFNGSSTLTQPQASTTYQLNVNYISNDTISQTQTSRTRKEEFGLLSTPTLPNGVTVNTDLEINTVILVSPYPNSYLYTVTCKIVKNGVNIPQTNQTVITTKRPMSATCSGAQNFIYTNNVVTTFNNFSFNSSDTIVIEILTTVTNNCENATPEVDGNLVELGPLSFDLEDYATTYRCCNSNIDSGSRVDLKNTTISGCGCCNVTSWSYFYNRS